MVSLLYILTSALPSRTLDLPGKCRPFDSSKVIFFLMTRQETVLLLQAPLLPKFQQDTDRPWIVPPGAQHQDIFDRRQSCSCTKLTRCMITSSRSLKTYQRNFATICFPCKQEVGLLVVVVGCMACAVISREGIWTKLISER